MCCGLIFHWSWFLNQLIFFSNQLYINFKVLFSNCERDFWGMSLKKWGFPPCHVNLVCQVHYCCLS